MNIFLTRSIVKRSVLLSYIFLNISFCLTFFISKIVPIFPLAEVPTLGFCRKNTDFVDHLLITCNNILTNFMSFINDHFFTSACVFNFFGEKKLEIAGTQSNIEKYFGVSMPPKPVSSRGSHVFFASISRSDFNFLNVGTSALAIFSDILLSFEKNACGSLHYITGISLLLSQKWCLSLLVKLYWYR